jgi:amino acid adenylation domain-containing protein
MAAIALHHALEESALRHADSEAFRYADTSLTYAETVHRSREVAALLQANKVQKGDRIGIYMQRSLESAVAVYGILMVGAIFVPLDPFAPAGATQATIAECGITLILSHKAQQRALEALRALVCPLTALRLFEDFDDAAGHSFTPVDVHANDLAYIITTSGSTGKPKGIMHTHASGLSYARLSAKTYGIRPGDRIGNHSPLHFDMATLGYLTAPYAGATTVIIPEAYTKLPASLSLLIEKERLTIWYSVPFALIQLLLQGALDKRDLASIRWVLYGGEPFPPKHLVALMARWPHARFSNVYGPAEVNQCTYYHVPSAIRDHDAEQPIPIGRVWDETDALIVDLDDRPVPRGEAGELLIHSSTMMQGYWGRDDLNARAFFDQDGKNFYRTGDLVRESADDNLMFLGRMDRQVKVRGHRVELDPVEIALTNIAGVQEAAAFALKDEEGDTRILAAVLTDSDATFTSDILRAKCSHSLPWYAVPAEITLLESFPRGATGKINREELKRRATFKLDPVVVAPAQGCEA